MSTAITSFTGEYRFLSNFALTPVTIGVIWPTAEHAYQAFKSRDQHYHDVILHTETPGQAKRLGRTVALRSDWEDVKVPIMTGIVTAKFRQNPSAATSLKETGNAWLTEGNSWHDQFWGDCFCGRPACTVVGRNVLGWILMMVRTSL